MSPRRYRAGCAGSHLLDLGDPSAAIEPRARCPSCSGETERVAQRLHHARAAVEHAAAIIGAAGDRRHAFAVEQLDGLALALQIAHATRDLVQGPRRVSGLDPALAMFL